METATLDQPPAASRTPEPTILHLAFPGLLLPAAVATALGRIALAMSAVVAWATLTGPATYWTIERWFASPLASLAAIAAVVAGLALVAWRSPAARSASLSAIALLVAAPCLLLLMWVSPIHLQVRLGTQLDPEGRPLDLTHAVEAADKAAAVPVGPLTLLGCGVLALGLGCALRRGFDRCAARLELDPAQIDARPAQMLIGASAVSLLLVTVTPGVARMCGEIGVGLPAGFEVWRATTPGSVPELLLFAVCTLIGVGLAIAPGVPRWLRWSVPGVATAVAVLGTVVFAQALIEVLTKL